MTTVFYFLRHGNTHLTDKGIYYGRTDVPLDQSGETQILKAASCLAEKEIDSIISSPLKRCAQSARIVGEKLNLDHPVTYMDELQELHFGIFEGLNYEQIGSRFPREKELWESRWREYVIPGGESFQAMAERVTGAVESLKTAYEGKRVAVVTHSGCIKSLLAFYIAGDLSHFWNFSIEPASVTELFFSGDFPVLKSLQSM